MGVHKLPNVSRGGGPHVTRYQGATKRKVTTIISHGGIDYLMDVLLHCYLRFHIIHQKSEYSSENN